MLGNRHKRQILLFLIAILVPAGVLIGLAGRILFQDRELATKRAVDQRRALAGPLGLKRERADDLSRWVLAHPDGFDATDLRCWRIGSDSWLSLAGEQLDSVDTVARPVGVFVVPAVGVIDRP